MSLECEYCKKTFATKNNLVAHQKRAKYCLQLRGLNTKVKKLRCPYCTKSFTKTCLKTHINTYHQKTERDDNMLQKKLQEQIWLLEEKDIALKELEKSIKEKDNTIKHLQKERETHIADAEISYQRVMKEKDLRYQSLEDEKEMQIERLEQQNRILRSDIEQQKREFKSDIEQQKIEYLSQIEQQKIEYLSQIEQQKIEYLSQIRALTDQLGKIAEKPRVVNKISKVHQMQVNNLQPYTAEHIQEQAEKHLTLEHVRKGPIGYRQFAVENNILDRLICVDKARLKGVYKDEQGEIVLAPGMDRIIVTFFRSIRDINTQLLNEQLKKVEEELSPYNGSAHAMKVINGIIQQKHESILIGKGEGEDTMLYKRFRKQLNTYLNA